jgi:predicted MFS family arabinose efflux permease
MTTTSQQKASYREVLANPRFRVLIGSRLLAIAADTLRTVALSVLVFTTTNSPLLAALTYGIAFLPQALGGVLLGALADRVRPRELIAVGYALECVAAILLGTLPMPTWSSLVVVAAVGAFTPVFSGAASRLMAKALTGDAYVLGRSLWNVTSSVAQLAGLAIGGGAVAAFGARHALLVTACAHLFACLLVLLLLPSMAPVPRTAARLANWAGTVAVLGDRMIRRLMFAQWLPSCLVASAEGLVVAYAADRGFPSGSAGLLLACLPVGMIIGNLLVGRLFTPPARDRLLVPLVSIMGAGLVPLVWQPSLVGTAALLVFTGCGFGYGLCVQKAFLVAVPADLQGQAFALLAAGLQTAQGLGPSVFGAIAELVVPGTAMALAGFAILGTALWLYLRKPTAEKNLRRVYPNVFPASQ